MPGLTLICCCIFSPYLTVYFFFSNLPQIFEHLKFMGYICKIGISRGQDFGCDFLII